MLIVGLKTVAVFLKYDIFAFKPLPSFIKSWINLSEFQKISDETRIDLLLLKCSLMIKFLGDRPFSIYGKISEIRPLARFSKYYDATTAVPASFYSYISLC